MKGLLIVSGVHARLSNISLDGKWIEDEEFMYKNKHVVRKSGKPVGRILTSFRKVREQKPEMKIIFISGYAEDAFRKHNDRLEDVSFLPKPFSLAQLATMVKDVLKPRG